MSVQDIFPELRGGYHDRAPTSDVHAISEVFDSIQGEGGLAGTPSTFIRYAHCNLTCSWCDAAYTWKGKIRFTEMTTDELVQAVRHRFCVITGGEPTIAPGFTSLVNDLRSRRSHVHLTVETNGTTQWRDCDPHAAVNLWSVSPKLGSSGQSDFLRADVVQHYVFSGRSHLKFVIDSTDDLLEMELFLDSLTIPQAYPVYVQPNGLCKNAELRDGELHEPYGDRFRWLVETVLGCDDLWRKYQIRVLPQVHKIAYGNQRGR